MTRQTTNAEILKAIDAVVPEHRHTWKARWVFPVSSPPIEHGCVEVEAGRILAVHSRGTTNRCTDLGNVALIPGLVNAHAHLEFSDLTEPLVPASPFTAWIQSVMGYRAERPSMPAAAIVKGATECLESGTTCVGEISTAAPNFATRTAGPRMISFRELIGFSPDRMRSEVDTAIQHLDQTANCSHLAYGLSPHAPYSVHPELLRQAADLASDRNAPLAMHVAETLAEIEYLARDSGEFVDFLRAIGLWQTGFVEHHESILPYLVELARVRHSLAVHCNYLELTEINFLADNPQVAVVFCPRTHSYFGHMRHPWRELVQRGASVAIGTDGRCSNPNLNLWQEAQWLHATRESVPAEKVLELVTLAGAKALGLSDEIGTLQPGKAADMAVVALASSSTDPFEALFENSHVLRAIRL